MFIDYSNPNKVVITHKGEKYTGYLHPNNFLAIHEKLNDYVFAVLSINDPKEFISNIVGYIPEDGAFPELMYKKDLIKVLDALNKEYDKKFGKSNKEFKVGDIVCIKAELKAGKSYGVNSFVSNMSKYRGKIATITNITEWGDYKLTIDDGYWSWTKEMLDKFEDPIPEDIGYTDLRADVGGYSFDQLAPIAVKESSWNQLTDMLESSTVNHLADTPITINDFIKEKKSYKLNFNN